MKTVNSLPGTRQQALRDYKSIYNMVDLSAADTILFESRLQCKGRFNSMADFNLWFAQWLGEGDFYNEDMPDDFNNQSSFEDTLSPFGVFKISYNGYVFSDES